MVRFVRVYLGHQRVERTVPLEMRPDERREPLLVVLRIRRRLVRRREPDGDRVPAVGEVDLAVPDRVLHEHREVRRVEARPIVRVGHQPQACRQRQERVGDHRRGGVDVLLTGPDDGHVHCHQPAPVGADVGGLRSASENDRPVDALAPRPIDSYARRLLTRSVAAQMIPRMIASR